MSPVLDVDPGFAPAAVRQLRGGLSRAAFARALAVTPQTVYRWELPLEAAEARRPRGEQLRRLREFARAHPLPRTSQQLTAANTSRSAGASDAELPRAPSESSLPLRAAESGAWVDDDTLRALPALERVMRGDLRRGHAELVQLATGAASLSANARGMVYFGVALCELVDRSDARAALLVVGPLLNDAEAGRFEPSVAARLFAVAALCHAWADAQFFDLGRVHAYQARAEVLARGGESEAACIAALAAVCAAALVGDLELLERAFARLGEIDIHAMPPLLAAHVEEFLAFRAMLLGQGSVTVAQFESAAQRAEERGYFLVQARTLARLALVQLDALVDPEDVLTVARRAKALGKRGRVAPGMHTPLSLKAEIEALLRLGRTAEALEVAGEVDAFMADAGMPALAAVSAQTRLYYLVRRVDLLHAQAARLRSCELPALRSICGAYADFVDAAAMLAERDDAATTQALLDAAESQAARWPFLLRDVLLYRLYSHLSAGQEPLARVALRRAQRYCDGFPSPWFTAHLRRLEGGLLAAGGHWHEGRQLLQSATATFELAKDRSDAVLTRYLMCLIASTFEPVDPEELAAVRRELAELGLAEPESIQRGVARFALAQRSRVAIEGAVRREHGSEQLVVPLQRVAMRGAAPSLILSELVAVVSELLPGRSVRLDELDSEGHARVLYGSERSAKELEWVEFSDGAGRLLRLGVVAPLGRDERASVSLLTATAALALEIAVLRSVGEHNRPRAPEQLAPELPGFVAASAEMRALRAELMRLARSRSTVIITGESGAGKEVVARAIHDLSERGRNAYVAFNCATVPRELFEGQLFGYRRGSFTGATSDHPGVIRAANGGTLFLDEIAELPLDIQPKLLRFLENSEVFPLGERAPVRVDVRVLAATHRDLARLVREGKFREDLYYRLQVVPVSIPPLRERRADIPVLARHFLRDLTRHGEPPVLAPDALAALQVQPYPGNVRELKNMIERALAYFPDQPVLRAEHLRLPHP